MQIPPFLVSLQSLVWEGKICRKNLMMRMTVSGCKENDEGVVDKGSCMDKSEVCDRVASGGKRHIDNGCSFLGNGLHDSRIGRMILEKRHIEGVDGRVLGGRRICQDDGWC